jgi:hypothetical protein
MNILDTLDNLNYEVKEVQKRESQMFNYKENDYDNVNDSKDIDILNKDETSTP